MKQQATKTVLFLFIIIQVLSCGPSKKSAGPFHTGARDHKDIPKPTGYVNDFEDIFSASEEMELTDLIKTHEVKTTNQVAVVTIKNYMPFSSLMDYSIELSNYWGVGQTKKNNGIVIVFGKQFREIWISVGSGLEAKLTDFETKQIIDNVILPEFKQGNYFPGTRKGLVAIIEKLEH